MTPLTFVFNAVFIMVLVAENIDHKVINSSLLHFQLANVGEDVTLPCSCQNTAFEYFWFKQGLELSPQLVAKCFATNDKGTFSKEFNNPRFSMDIKESNYQLKISNLKISDSAIYYCLAGNNRNTELCNATTLSVKGLSLNISASVHRSETIQPGEPETLSCTIETLTCSGEHSVYWFMESGGSQPGLIYTQGGNNDQCLRKPRTQTPTCEYSLPVKRLNLSHTGTYYCAVAACGQILFGGGTKLDINKCGDSVLVYCLGAALVLALVAVACLSFSLYKMKRHFAASEHFTSLQLEVQAILCAANTKGHLGNLYCADSTVSLRSQAQKDPTWSECVFHRVKL